MEGQGEDYSQQGSKQLHGVDHCIRQRDCSTDARERRVLPKRIRDQRWPTPFDPVMRPSNERRKRSYSKTQNNNGLSSFDPRGISAQDAAS